jgi:hypothetical protein
VRNKFILWLDKYDNFESAKECCLVEFERCGFKREDIVVLNLVNNDEETQDMSRFEVVPTNY